jgi:hypothetical protein
VKYADRDRSQSFESRDGIVTATAKIVHKGRSIHLWEIRITDERNNLISLCKLTNMILPKKRKAKINNGISESKKHLQEELPLFCIANPILKRLLVFFRDASIFQVDDFTEKDLLFRL